MKKFRKQLIMWLFDWTMIVYCKFKNKKPWNITTTQLLAMEASSFGHHLGLLLQKNGFQLIPKVERHDAYHLLTGFSTSVEDEIALQYCCYGNGKKTLYLFGVLLVGTLLLPEYVTYYIKAYKYGKEANTFHHFNYKQVLPLNFNTFKASIFTPTAQAKIAFYKPYKSNSLST